MTYLLLGSEFIAHVLISDHFYAKIKTSHAGCKKVYRKVSFAFLALVLILSFSVNSSALLNNHAHVKSLNIFTGEYRNLAFADSDEDKDKDEQEKKGEHQEDKDKDEQEKKGEHQEKNENQTKNEHEEEQKVEIKVEIENGIAKIKVELSDQKLKFKLNSTDKDTIIKEIVARTGLSKDQVEASIEIEEDHGNQEPVIENEHHAMNQTEMRESEKQAVQKSDEIIRQLQQKIDQLEQRLQSLLSDLQTGEYFGPTLGGDAVTKSYTLSFFGVATAEGNSTKTDSFSGNIFFENLVTRNDVTKFRVTGGTISIGNTNYDLVFGKARVTASSSGEKDSMVLIGQIIDDDGNVRTLKMLLHTDSPLVGNFGTQLVSVDILEPQSKIAGQWFLNGSGELSQLNPVT